MEIDKAMVGAETNNPLVAVAVDNDIGSQNALKWAIEHLVKIGQTLVLVHVNTKAPSGGQEDATGFKPATDPVMKGLFLPYRCFCTRKNIQCKEIVLDNKDIVKALIDFASHAKIEKFVLGSPAKYNIMREAKTTDIPSYVSKGAPDFCTVYIISQMKDKIIMSFRKAVRAAPSISPLHQHIVSGRLARSGSPSVSREEPSNHVCRNENTKTTNLPFSPPNEDHLRKEETNMCTSARKEKEEKKRNDGYGISLAIIAFKELQENGFTFEFDDLDKAITLFMSSVEIREVFLTLEPNDRALWIRRRIDGMRV